MSLTINQQAGVEPGHVTISLSGRFVYLGSAPFLTNIRETIGDDSVTHVVVDMEGVDYIDSSGIGAIVMANQHAAQHKKFFNVVKVHGLVRKILEVSNIHQMMEIEFT